MIEKYRISGLDTANFFEKNGLKMFKNIFRLIIDPVVTKYVL